MPPPTPGRLFPFIQLIFPQLHAPVRLQVRPLTRSYGIPRLGDMRQGSWNGKGGMWSIAQMLESLGRIRMGLRGAHHSTGTSTTRTANAFGHAWTGGFRWTGCSSSAPGKASARGPFNQSAHWQSRVRQQFWGSSRRGTHSYHHKLHRRKCKLDKEKKRLKTCILYFLASRAPKCCPPPRTSFVAKHPQFLPQMGAAISATPPLPGSKRLYHPNYPSLFRSTSLRLSLRAPVTTLASFAHLFCSTSRRSFKMLPPPPPVPVIQVLEAGFHLIMPLAAVLKSSAALTSITWLSRIALIFLPFSLRAKIIHSIRETYLREGTNASAWIQRMVNATAKNGVVTPSGVGHRFNAYIIAPALLFLPIFLLGSIIFASLENTPITGRKRIIMLSPDEEEDLVHSILHVGEERTREGLSRDWVTILQSVLGLADEGVSSTGRRILLGGEVLSEQDWRCQWTKAILIALEAGIPILSGEITAHGFPQNVLMPPETAYPLLARCGTGSQGKLNVQYDLLIIDRAESNAFSFGFGPDEVTPGGAGQSGKRGVIVVYSGFLDEILGNATSVTSRIASLPKPSRDSFFSYFYSSLPSSALPSNTTEPTTPPTLAQTKSLATLLSHELAHLLLSHTLESYANTTLLIPHLQKMFSDVFRTLIFPITAMLGPFINDGIGNSMNELHNTPGFLGRMANSCESRKLECEADVVGLRLLSYAGIDPRHALDFWEQRLTSPSFSAKDPLQLPSTSSNHLRLHTGVVNEREVEGDEMACGFLRSHPANAERIKKIREELEMWMRVRG